MQPSAEQALRASTAGGKLLSIIPWAWEIDSLGGSSGCGPCSGGPPIHYARFAEEPLSHRYTRTISRLSEELPGVPLELSLAEVLCFPSCWRPEPSPPGKESISFFIGQQVAARHSCEKPTEQAIDLVGRRLRHMLERPFDSSELRPEEKQLSLPPHGYLFPGVAVCIDLLIRMSTDPRAVFWIQDVVAGRLDSGPIELPPSFQCEPRMSYEIHRGDLLFAMPFMLERLWQIGLIDEEAIRSAVDHLPGIMSLAGPVSQVPLLPGPSGQAARRLPAGVIELVDQAAWDLARSGGESEIRAFSSGPRPRGVRYLIQACEHVERLGLSHLPRKQWYGPKDKGVAAALAHMAEIAAFQPGDDLPAALEQLKSFRRETLLAVLPTAGAGTMLVLEAMGWEPARTLVKILRRVGRLDLELRSEAFVPIDIPNSPDAETGTLDRSEVASALEQAGDTVRPILEAYRAASAGIDKTLLVVEAVLGTNRKQVLAGLQRHGQAAIKAYGLLPLEREDEVLERYLTLRKLEKECSRFGAGRQANELAAIETGLAHLAQTAGLVDSRALEWLMELRVGAESGPRSWDVGDYKVEALCAGGDPSLHVSRKGRPLKSVPRAVRASSAYGEARESVDRLRGQAARFRAGLEDRMADETPLSRADVERMVRMPAAATVLRGLVLATADGHFGLLDEGSSGLESPFEEPAPLPDRVFVAHPIRLSWTGQLAGWQSESCKRRLTQPFPQLFREVYCPEDLEFDSYWTSSRFAGRSLRANVAAKLLQKRGWRFESGDHAVPYRAFPSLGLQAVLEVPDAGHFLTETPRITSGGLFFRSYSDDGLGGRLAELGRLDPRKVPRVVFSEVLRDVDLAVSLAQESEREELSKERYEKRGERIIALAHGLGLKGVSHEGRFVRVRGVLAEYKVHLATMEAYAEPGGHLPNLPRPGHEGPEIRGLGNGEDWVRGVIDKVATLTRDAEIRDPNFLRQIRGMT